MNRKKRFVVIRHLISVVLVVFLCAFYHNSTGRVFVWFFVPISLIPMIITFWDNYCQQKENTEAELMKDEKLNMPNAEESKKK